MADRRRRIVRSRVEEPEEDELEELEDELEELEDEPEAEEAPKPTRRSRRIVEEEEEEEVVKAAPAKASAKKDGKASPKKEPEPAPVKAATKNVAKAAPAEEEEAAEEEAAEEEAPAPAKAKIRKVDSVVAGEILTGLLDGLEEGKAIVVTRNGENKWQFAMGDAVVAAGGAGKLRGKEFWATVRSPEYDKWRADWKQKTFDEKKKYATKIGAAWEPHENPQIEVMRITAAVREKLGIEKYKPEFASRSARAALRGR